MKKPFILHPVFFSLIPVLLLYSYNAGTVQFSYLLRPMIIIFLSSVIIFIILNLLYKDRYKTGVITFLALLLFFSYGHVLSFMPNFNTGKFIIYGHYLLSFFWLGIFFYITLLLLKIKRLPYAVTHYLNFVGLILIIIAILNIGVYEFKARKIIAASDDSLNISEAINASIRDNNLPDIYYIILDGYARSDILRELYNYDNNDFENFLSSRGFYTASQSRSNYAQTFFSLPSSLNLEYINDTAEKAIEDKKYESVLKNMVNENYIYDFLKQRGYRTVAVPTGWAGADNIKADINISYPMSLSEFDDILINSTPLSIYYGKAKMLNYYRNKTLHAFKKIPEVALIEAPTFVYAHFFLTHPPFVFDRNGNPVVPAGRFSNMVAGDGNFEEFPDQNVFKNKYIDQIIFANKKTKIMIDKIIENSETEPIIIIQADHGSGLFLAWPYTELATFKERMSILNSYLLPEECKGWLYPSITPVNTFRLIFNCLFKNDFSLLPDKNYFSSHQLNCPLTEVTQVLQQ